MCLVVIIPSDPASAFVYSMLTTRYRLTTSFALFAVHLSWTCNPRRNCAHSTISPYLALITTFSNDEPCSTTIRIRRSTRDLCLLKFCASSVTNQLTNVACTEVIVLCAPLWHFFYLSAPQCLQQTCQLAVVDFRCGNGEVTLFSWVGLLVCTADAGFKCSACV